MLLIGPGTVITRDPAHPLIADGAVLTEGGTIKAVGDWAQLAAENPDAEQVAARGRLIMPGFINAHQHIYSAFSRGLSLDGYDPHNFLEILEQQWWRMDETMNLDDTRASAQAVYLACLRGRVTCIFDHHASYGQTGGSLFAIAEEAARFGVRSSLCYEISDRNGYDEMKRAVQENLEFARHSAGDPDHLAGLIGLHASFTLSDDSLDYIREQNTENFGYHVHVAEGILDQERSLSEHGKRVVPRLADFGILSERSLAGHCVHVNEDELDILSSTGVGVVFNPESNMGNAVGAPDILAMLERDILVGLGTDGYTSDMLESLKFANLLIKHSAKDATVGGAAVPALLFEGNRRLAGRHFPRPMGVLKPGAYADVIILNYDQISPVTAGNVDFHMLFGMNGLNVATTISDGVVRMLEGEIVGIDVDKLTAGICAQSADFAVRVNN